MPRVTGRLQLFSKRRREKELDPDYLIQRAPCQVNFHPVRLWLPIKKSSDCHQFRACSGRGLSDVSQSRKYDSRTFLLTDLWENRENLIPKWYYDIYLPSSPLPPLSPSPPPLSLSPSLPLSLPPPISLSLSLSCCFAKID